MAGKFQRFLVLLWVGVSLSAVAWSGSRKPSEFPPEEVVEASNVRSVFDVITRMSMSHSYLQSQTSAVTAVGVDLIDATCQQLEAFIRDRSIPNSEKGILMTRYGASAPCLIELLIKAKKAGFGEVILLTDLNRALEGGFREGERHHNRFGSKEVHVKDDAIGRAIGQLREAGFRFRTHADKNASYGISSIPLYNKRGESDQVDLMHMKHSVTYRVKIRGAERTRTPVNGFEFSTGNLVPPNERENRKIDVSDVQIAQRVLDHDFTLMNTFADPDPKKNEVYRIPVIAPLKVVYGAAPRAGEFDSRSSMTIYFTDGRYDLNQKQVDLLQDSASHPEERPTVFVLSSQFAFTNTPWLDALEAAMQSQKEFPVFHVGDGRFSLLYGPGIGAALDGQTVYREFGAPVKGLSYDLSIDSQKRRRVKAFFWVKDVSENIPESGVDPDGEPRYDHVWHDKSNIIIRVENGHYVAYIFTGSFNNSRHFQSAESQVQIRIPLGLATSERTQKIMNELKATTGRVGIYTELFKMFSESGAEFLRDFVESVVNDVKASPNSAPFMTVGNLISVLAQMTGHRMQEVSPAFAQNIADDLRGGNQTRVIERIQSLGDSPTKVSSGKRLSKEERERRLKNLSDFMTWYQDHRKSSFDFYKLLKISLYLTHPHAKAISIKSSLRSVLWKEGISEEALEADIAAIWNLWQPRTKEGELVPLPQPQQAAPCEEALSKAG